jgi:hypothetical protein
VEATPLPPPPFLGALPCYKVTSLRYGRAYTVALSFGGQNIELNVVDANVDKVACLPILANWAESGCGDKCVLIAILRIMFMGMVH